MNDDEVNILARKIRLTVITRLWATGQLPEADARELLAGCLTPNDEDTRFDDSALLGDFTAFEQIDKKQ